MMAKHDYSKPYKLEERARMGRLFEEITGRVQELSAMRHEAGTCGPCPDIDL